MERDVNIDTNSDPSPRVTDEAGAYSSLSPRAIGGVVEKNFGIPGRVAAAEKCWLRYRGDRESAYLLNGS